MSLVELKSISKSYGAVEVLKGIDLQVTSGEFVVLLGPSGCGKSTLLRIIAGLEDESAGDVLLDGRSILNLPPAKRGIAMVFQTYALYPHLTVRGNMALVLKQARYKKAEIARRVAESARALELEGLLDRKPAELSGGQRQRVAIGRAIVRDPDLFLFDEPLSNLDAALRGQVRIEIARLHQRLAATMIYVTHDQVEAMTLADRIVVLDRGIVQQIGTPRELYERPANRFVAGFIGSPPMNFLPLEEVALGFGRMANGPRFALGDVAQHGPAILGFRPHDLQLTHAPQIENGQEHGLKAEIMLEEYLGEASYVHLRAETGHELIARVDPGHPHAAGQSVWLHVSPETLHLFDAASGERIGVAPASLPPKKPKEDVK